MNLSKHSLLPEVIAGVPGARAVFDRYGLTGCGGEAGPHETLEFFAKVHGVDLDTLIDELKNAKPEAEPPTEAPDELYRRFFKAGIVVILTAGALLGAISLFLYGLRGSFAPRDLFGLVQAHANAQVFGWVGLFVMGFAVQAFPRFKYTRLHRPDLAEQSLHLMVAGIFLRMLSTVPADAVSIWIGVAGGVLEAAAVLLFVYVMIRTLRKGLVRDPYDRYVAASLLFFALTAIIEPILYHHVFSAPTVEAMARRAEVYRGPYRDLQLAGFAAFMILGVSHRILPTAFGFRTVPASASAIAFIYLVAGLLLAPAMPWPGHALYLLGVLMLVGELRVFGSAAADRSVKFIRAAYAWLIVAGAMMFLEPVAGSTAAWIGAWRHAFTVGFISMMIVGVSLKIVPILVGAPPAGLPSMAAAFWLLNLGNAARVTTQVMTDRYPWAFKVMGVTGVFEVAGLAIWGIHIWRVLDGKFAGAPARDESARIDGSTIVASVIDRFPATLDVFVSFGFTMLRNPMLRNTLGRGVTVEQACRVHGVDPAKLVEALNAAATPGPAPEEAHQR